MGFQFSIKPFGINTKLDFSFDTLAEGLTASENAVERGYHRSKNFGIKLGPGTVLTLMSEEALNKVAHEDRQTAQSAGLILQERFDFKDGYMLAVQFGQKALPPLHFATLESVDSAIDAALESGVLEYIFEIGHDYLFIMLGTGTCLISMPVADYNKARREAIVQMQRQAAQQVGAQPAEAPKILLR
jgi:hypothetical protein